MDFDKLKDVSVEEISIAVMGVLTVAVSLSAIIPGLEFTQESAEVVALSIGEIVTTIIGSILVVWALAKRVWAIVDDATPNLDLGFEDGENTDGR